MSKWNCQRILCTYKCIYLCTSRENLRIFLNLKFILMDKKIN